MSSHPPVALVTGAGRGIGRALAHGLSRDGFAVGLVGRHRETLQEAAADLTGPFAVASADVTDADAVGRAVDEVEAEIGPVEVLVNNAGRNESREVPLWESDPDDWWGVVETNVRGPFLLAHRLAPDMVRRGSGRIITISTGSALRDSAVYSAYGVSKTAALRLSGCLHEALAPHGVHVFDVAPGVVRTDMTARMPLHDDRSEWTDADDVATLVTRLARGEADGLAGRLLRVDTDDLDELVRRLGASGEHARRLRLQPCEHARRLRLQPYGEDDPLRPA